jgi:hypothetical protein
LKIRPENQRHFENEVEKSKFQRGGGAAGARIDVTARPDYDKRELAGCARLPIEGCIAAMQLVARRHPFRFLALRKDEENLR